MNKIEYSINDLSHIKFRLEFIKELNILTIGDVPKIDFPYYHLNESFLDNLEYFNRIISLNKRIDNFSITNKESKLDMLVQIFFINSIF